MPKFYLDKITERLSNMNTTISEASELFYQEIKLIGDFNSDNELKGNEYNSIKEFFNMIIVPSSYSFIRAFDEIIATNRIVINRFIQAFNGEASFIDTDRLSDIELMRTEVSNTIRNLQNDRDIEGNLVDHQAEISINIETLIKINKTISLINRVIEADLSTNASYQNALSLLSKAVLSADGIDKIIYNPENYSFNIDSGALALYGGLFQNGFNQNIEITDSVINHFDQRIIDTILTSYIIYKGPQADVSLPDSTLYRHDNEWSILNKIKNQIQLERNELKASISYSYGSEISHEDLIRYFKDNNQFPYINFGFNCTTYAYGRVRMLYGMAGEELPVNFRYIDEYGLAHGNANEWIYAMIDDKIKGNYYFDYSIGPNVPKGYTESYGKLITTSMTTADFQKLKIRPGDILVYGKAETVDGQASGHVRIVESVTYDANGKVTSLTVSEGNWGGQANDTEVITEDDSKNGISYIHDTKVANRNTTGYRQLTYSISEEGKITQTGADGEPRDDSQAGLLVEYKDILVGAIHTDTLMKNGESIYNISMEKELNNRDNFVSSFR